MNVKVKDGGIDSFTKLLLTRNQLFLHV